MATSTIKKEPADRIVLSIPANTYTTYALALAAMETAFNGLSSEQKRNSYIIYNGTTKAVIDNTSAKQFVRSLSFSDGLALLSFDLKEHTRQFGKVTPTSYEVTDQSANAQSQSLALLTIF